MITSFFYKKGGEIETNLSRARLLSALSEKGGLLWVDLEEPSEFESDSLVEIFNFHPLAVEDCMTDQSQPKLDDYDEYLFMVVHAIAMHDKGSKRELRTVELDIFIGENFVVTFHKEPLASVTQVRELVQKKTSALMGSGPGLLVHSLLDHLVDRYLPVLNEYDEKIDSLEKEMFRHTTKDFLKTLLQVKQDVFHLRRIVGPQRDTLYSLTRDSSAFIRTEHLMYFRDVYDHLFRIYGMAEAYHENLNNILQVYFSYSSFRLNEVLKHLTVLATVTMPPVIIASIYGMNFKHFPELEWALGYPFAIGLCVLSSLVTLVWMKFKKWI
ncbi:MAG: magnesium and cobalt transport protein CorA [Omnitrophica bacterium RIFOXYB12_FULL_50_7]|nr:MAG: magnesium and cobalt transport protein CorA [Omnitrophica bacterium RIFOXYB12_FULL_50_7]